MILRLVNFKSYADETIEFDGVTSFVGENGHGKTNIFRALRIVCHHESWPERWLRHGTTSGMIEFTLDGVTVRRKRTRTNEKTEIQIGDKIEVFTGKVDATTAVKKALGFFKVPLDNPKLPADLNFIPVFSTPFLLTDPPQTAYKKLTAITGGQELELARKEITKSVNTLKTERDATLASVQSLEQQHKNLQESLKETEKRFSKIEKAQSIYDSKAAEVQTLEELLAEQATLPNENHLEKVLSRAESLDAAYEVFQKAWQNYQLISQYSSALDAQESQESELTICEETEQAWVSRHKHVLSLLGVCPTCGTRVA